jgi:hypothetical protein
MVAAGHADECLSLNADFSALFRYYLSARWASGCTRGRQLLEENPATRLHGQLFESGAPFDKMETCETRGAVVNSCFDARSRDNNCDRSCNSCCDASRYRSSNRLADFADCRCGALHEAARIANPGSPTELDFLLFFGCLITTRPWF